jgi:HNH endonuclease
LNNGNVATRGPSISAAGHAEGIISILVKNQPMPPPNVPKIAKCYLHYFYAKHCLAPLAGRDRVWGYIINRYQRMETGEIPFDTADSKLLSWLSSHRKCLFCQNPTRARARMISSVESAFNTVPFCPKCQKSKGEEQVWDWWVTRLGNRKSILPNLPVALWLRMAYERHRLEDGLHKPVGCFEDLWRWPEIDSEITLILEQAELPIEEGIPDDIWRSDPSARYPWTDAPEVGQLLSWSYAQLAMIAVILKRGDYKFQTEDYYFRKSFYERMYTERISPTSLMKDEMARRKRRTACVYCGCCELLSLDHLLPKSKGGPDEGFNLVTACRSCNSAKLNADLLVWFHGRKELPPLHLLRRYLKLVIQQSKNKMLWNRLVTEVPSDTLPFDFKCLPPGFPDLRTLVKREESYEAMFQPPIPEPEPASEQLMLGFD